MRYLFFFILFSISGASLASEIECFKSLKTFTKKLVKIEYHGEVVSKEESDFFSDGVDEVMALATLSGLDLPKKKLKV